MSSGDATRAVGREPEPESSALEAMVGAELSRPAPKAAALLAEQFVRRHGDCVAAVLFYGSCLREGSVDGVLDFYVLVDRYRDAYASRALAWANAALPPNVFYLEVETEIGTLRCKYAVVSCDDFDRGARPGGLRSSIWARFCQPALVAWTRDAAAHRRTASAVTEAVVTAVDRVVPLMADSQGVARFNSEQLWLRVLQETYSAEWRTESPKTIQSLHAADPERYSAATRGALDCLARRGRVKVDFSGGGFEFSAVSTSQAGPQPVRRPLAKFVYLLGLLKSIATFGDWLPYALWKLERHTGNRIELTDRQRRHPLVWGWPVLLRVLRQRDLH
ncbi:MAG: hypothetical protein VCE43_05640 [Myxococcota bacterium]